MIRVLALALLLASCGDDGNDSPKRPEPVATGWQIGPVIAGKNYSVNFTPPYGHEGSWAFDIPQAGGHVNYVTIPVASLIDGPLSDYSKITMRYRIEAPEFVRLVAKTDPNAPPLLTLYLQRRGDNWSARGDFEAYRWYATQKTVMSVLPGEGQVEASFTDKWTAVLTSASDTPDGAAQFRAALADTYRVGFVLGGGDGYGHGVYATGPAKFVILSFEIE